MKLRELRSDSLRRFVHFEFQIVGHLFILGVALFEFWETERISWFILIVLSINVILSKLTLRQIETESGIYIDS